MFRETVVRQPERIAPELPDVRACGKGLVDLATGMKEARDKGSFNGDIDASIDLDMDVDSGMAVSINWVVHQRGFGFLLG